MNVAQARWCDAAAREARNGPDFLARVHDLMASSPSCCGRARGELSALGVNLRPARARRLAGDLGGRLARARLAPGDEVGEGSSLKLGGLALMDEAGGSLKKAEKIVPRHAGELRVMRSSRGGLSTRWAGTSGALARLHIGQPLSAAGDATAMPCGARRGRVRELSSASTPRRSIRSPRSRGAAAALAMGRWCSTSHPHRQAEGGGDLGDRRARGPRLRAALASGPRRPIP